MNKFKHILDKVCPRSHAGPWARTVLESESIQETSFHKIPCTSFQFRSLKLWRGELLFQLGHWDLDYGFWSYWTWAHLQALPLISWVSMDKPLNLAESVSSFQNNKGGVICIFGVIDISPANIYIAICIYSGIYMYYIFIHSSVIWTCLLVPGLSYCE